ncbi:MAG: helix-turn-helix domain-containing protein [Actinobacteria bacterium]|nr:helix-turn-helix domain-containing protein [Actinomycetota bacterium]
MTVGTQIAQARIAAGLSVAEVAAKVRLRNSVLVAIESDNFDPCGGEVYARGHVRSIATALGMDVNELMVAFGLQVKPAASALNQMASMLRPEKRTLPWAPIMAAAAVVIAGVIGFSLFVGEKNPLDPPLASAVTTDILQNDPSMASNTPSASEATALLTDDVTVIIAAVSESSWIAITSDSGAQLFAGILQKGATKEFHDPQHLRVVIGNAGAVTLSVNGKKLGTPGGSREVLHFDFGTGDPTQG